MFELTVRQKIAVLVLLIILAIGGCLLYIFGSRPYTPVSTTPETEGKLYIHVSGAVVAPGLYTVKPGTRKLDALKLAGGSRTNADLNRVNLAGFVEDGEQIYVPKKGEPLPDAPKSKKSKTSTKRKATPKPKIRTTPTPPGPWNLNTATLEQLDAIPGIGPSLAAKIIQFRTEQGLFQSYEDLQKVSGVGPAKLEKFRPYLLVP